MIILSVVMFMFSHKHKTQKIETQIMYHKICQYTLYHGPLRTAHPLRFYRRRD